MPGYGGTQRLPRVVGEARALEMIMTGRTVRREEAERIGLVNRLVEGDPVEAGIAFAREFTGYSLPVLAFAREAVKRALDVPIHEGLKIEAIFPPSRSRPRTPRKARPPSRKSASRGSAMSESSSSRGLVMPGIQRAAGLRRVRLVHDSRRWRRMARIPGTSPGMTASGCRC